MKLNQTTQYAIRLLIVLASNQNKFLIIKNIAKHLKISYKYLGAIVTSLVKAGLVESAKGRHGGIRLARSADEIRLIDILDAIEEPYSENECILGIGMCGGVAPCALHSSWEKAQAVIRETFGNSTLASLEIHADTSL